MVEFGEATEIGSNGKKEESNAKWIGAKFDKESELDLDIISKFDEIQGNMSLKKAIAEMIVYVHTNISGDESENEEESDEDEETEEEKAD